MFSDYIILHADLFGRALWGTHAVRSTVSVFTVIVHTGAYCIGRNLLVLYLSYMYHLELYLLVPTMDGPNGQGHDTRTHTYTNTYTYTYMCTHTSGITHQPVQRRCANLSNSLPCVVCARPFYKAAQPSRIAPRSAACDAPRIHGLHQVSMQVQGAARAGGLGPRLASERLRSTRRGPAPWPWSPAARPPPPPYQ